MVIMNTFEENILVNLVQKLFRGCSNFQIEPEDVKHMTWSWQDKFLEATYKKGYIKKYPINGELSRIFLKRLINYIEPVHEVHDGLYTELCNAMNSKGSDEYCYRHYVVGNDLGNVITMKETKNMVVNGTTGMRTWEAAVMLSNWILHNPELFASKDILELGSGIGYTGISLVKACTPKSVMMTDCHQDVLKVLRENVEINLPHLRKTEHDSYTKYEQDGIEKVGVMTLDWNEIDNLPESIRPDIILGADIIYDPSILEPLCNTLKLFSERQKNLDIYIACIVRNEETFNSFLKVIEASNFKHENIILPTNSYIEWDYSNGHRCLLKIGRR